MQRLVFQSKLFLTGVMRGHEGDTSDTSQIYKPWIFFDLLWTLQKEERRQNWMTHKYNGLAKIRKYGIKQEKGQKEKV